MYTLAEYHVNDCKLDEKVSQSRFEIIYFRHRIRDGERGRKLNIKEIARA